MDDIVTLLSKSANDMHLKFFINDKKLDCFKIKIIASEERYIIPYRNLSCSNPECIYDEVFLKEMIKSYVFISFFFFFFL